MKNIEYKDTLNLPKSSFSMRANLSEKEPKIIERWDREKVYEESIKGNKEFIFHDGPPYANGDIHLGTSFNKILKDILLKYKRMQGYSAAFVPGWDTHGLPIELAVTREDLVGDKLGLRKRFRAHAEKYISRHLKDFKRLGIVADWKKPYITMDPKFESEELKIFADLVDNKLVYHSLKPVHWCTATKTALAESEVVYRDHKSDSLYLKFKASVELEEKFDLKNIHFAVWTTTPWTLPANLAIALNPDLEYILFESNLGNLIFSLDLLEDLKDKLNLSGKIIKKFKGSEIENYEYFHPFIDRKGKVILGNHVLNSSGTGCVHTAPGHGLDDYVVGHKYGLGILSPISADGHLTEEAEVCKGMFYLKANREIIQIVKERELLLLNEKFSHSYPYSERGKVPIVFRATKQWFIKTKEDLIDRALNAIENISFIPEFGRKRLNSMISNRPDWCISRQRVWGVPIPVFYCESCGEPLLDSNLIRSIADLVSKSGSEIFLELPTEDILKDRYSCCGDKKFRKGEDIFDVWFDSGVSYASVMKDKIADIYLEGSDQHRGWFQTSLLTSIGSRSLAPYKKIITHGFVLDGDGIKMSKSLGNVILPQDVVKKYGADILRLWTSSVDFSNDVKISDEILKQHVDSYRKIRNFFRFMLGNISDLDDNQKTDLLHIDRLALERTESLVVNVEEKFDNYEFHNGLTLILNFVTEMSSFYMDILKNRLYASARKSNERVSAQIVLKEIATVLAKLLTPILSFTMEEVWNEIDSSSKSILLERWPKSENHNSKIWDMLVELRYLVNVEIEKNVKDRIINRAEESDIELIVTDKYADVVNLFSAVELREIFKVATVNIAVGEEIKVYLHKSNGVKCERCWLYFKQTENGVCERCKNVIKS